LSGIHQSKAAAFLNIGQDFQLPAVKKIPDQPIKKMHLNIACAIIRTLHKGVLNADYD
jgi:hypothetical protein